MKWRAIPGFEGQYEASDTGLIRSLDRTVETKTGPRRYAGKLLSPGTKGNSEHLQVSLRGKTRSVHALVLETFVGPCPPGMEARHIDDDPRNNNLANLEWGTRSQNCHDRVRNGRNHHARKTHCKYEHPLSGANLRIDSRGYRQCITCERRRSQEHAKKNPKKRAESQCQYKRRQCDKLAA